MSGSPLTAIIKKNQAEGKLTKAPYLPAAFPQADAFWKIMKELAGHGADIIEIGVPFSDPIADGPVLAAASQKALANGADLDYILNGLDQYRAELPCGLILMGYVNPFIQYYWRQAAEKNAGGPVADIVAESLRLLADRLARSGVNGLIVPDLPLEESRPWLRALSANGLELIALVGPNTSLEKMRRYAQSGAGGYVYVMSVMGTTGVREGLPPEVENTLLRAREAFDLPLALGFGLSSPRQIQAISQPARPEAAVFGSALVKHLAGGGRAADFMAVWNETGLE